MKNKQAFTLIELLVVVLIIGILAAVAVPQYKVAVMKSRVATLRPLLAAVVNAQKAYYLANNTYATEFDALSIDFPAGWVVNYTGGVVSAFARKDKMRLYVNYDSLTYPGPDARICQNTGYSCDQILKIKYYMSNGQQKCFAYTDLAKKVCKSMGTYEYSSTSEGYDAYVL